MRYLITTDGYPPFAKKYYEFDNHFNSEIGMIVYDLVEMKYSTDGVNFIVIEIDHL